MSHHVGAENQTWVLGMSNTWLLTTEPSFKPIVVFVLFEVRSHYVPRAGLEIILCSPGWCRVPGALSSSASSSLVPG